MFNMTRSLAWLLLGFIISSASANDLGSIGDGLFPDDLDSANDDLYIPAALHPNATGTVSTTNLTLSSATSNGYTTEPYTWRTNVSSISLISSANYNNSSMIANTVHELIMSDTTLARIAARDTNLVYFSFAVPANFTQAGQDDTGDCAATLGSACADAVVQAILAVPLSIPTQPAACAARLGSDAYGNWPIGFDGDGTAWTNSAGSWFSNMSVPTNTTDVDVNGLYPASEDPYLRILDWNSVASRAAVLHLSSPETAQGNYTRYYQAIERVIPIVVAEVGAGGGAAKWASITCLRAKNVANGSKSLDDENGAASLLSGGHGIGLAGVVAFVVATFVAFG